ncbi:MAG: FMN-binding protein [Acidimicrobiales bacterium]
MKRAPFVIAGTAAGLGLLLSFHTKPVTVNLGTAIGSSSAKSTSKTAVATGSSSSRSSKSSSSASKTGSSTTSSSAPSKSSAAGATRSAVGAAVNYNYGVVAVKVTASGSRVTNVTIASLNDGGNFRSVSIDEAAIPTLEQEALSAQNANIQGVSGATYTSAGFAQSLQSALKKLGI